MGKLVRDRIPLLMREAGFDADVRIASDAEIFGLLCDKLIEEAAELRSTPNVEELADLSEVIFALRALLKISQRTLDDEILRKRSQKGGFLSRLVLTPKAP